MLVESLLVLQKALERQQDVLWFMLKGHAALEEKNGTVELVRRMGIITKKMDFGKQMQEMIL